MNEQKTNKKKLANKSENTEEQSDLQMTFK